MLTFKQFVSELATRDVALSPAEVREMIAHFGDKVLQMGHLQDDGTLLVPVECIVEAARTIGSQALAEAAGALQGQQFASMLRSGSELVDKVAEARERKLRNAIRAFQNEPDAQASHRRWKEIEREIFGVDYRD